MYHIFNLVYIAFTDKSNRTRKQRNNKVTSKNQMRYYHPKKTKKIKTPEETKIIRSQHKKGSIRKIFQATSKPVLWMESNICLIWYNNKNNDKYSEHLFSNKLAQTESYQPQQHHPKIPYQEWYHDNLPYYSSFWLFYVDIFFLK